MGKLLAEIQKRHNLHIFLRKIHGKTVGLHFFKEWFARNIGFYNGEKRLKLLSRKKSEKLILSSIKSDKPFMLARYGSTEFRTLFGKTVESLHIYSGFFPNDDNLLPKLKKEYFNASKQIDVLAIWNYKNNFLNKIKYLKNFPNIRTLVPLSAAGKEVHPWIGGLKGKRVLVIHPFKSTIKSQYKNIKQLGILPELKSLQVIKAVQTIAGNNDSRFMTWFDALDYMKKEIAKRNFDIALIGCGAYGLPLAAYVKSEGKQAVHIGGGLQLLFGIKGKRWDKMGKTYNKHWIYPLEEDIPKNSEKIEGGCYW